MFETFTEEARRVIFFARYEASNFGSREITAEHLLLGFLRENTRLVTKLAQSPATWAAIRSQIEAQSARGEKVSTSTDLPLSHESKRVLAYAIEESQRLGHKHVAPLHLLIGLVREENTLASSLLRQHEISLEALREKLKQPETIVQVSAHPPAGPDMPELCRDLTAVAEGNSFPPLIGREREMETILQVLGRRNGNNPALVGESGVGKTAIVEGLAQRIADGKVPEFLLMKRILALDSQGFMDSAQNRREFRHKFTEMMTQITEQSNRILFIDRLFEPAARTGGPLGEVLADLLAALSFSQSIATGTPVGYRQAVERDPVVERYFRVIEIVPPGETDAVQIVSRVKEQFEQFHRVNYDTAALEVAVTASVQFLPRRHLPEKALDLLDEAGARAKIRSERGDGSSKLVTKEDIQKLISERAGVPIDIVRKRLEKK